MDLAAGTVLRTSWGFDRVVTQDAPNLSAPPNQVLLPHRNELRGRVGCRWARTVRKKLSIPQSHVGSRKKEEL